MKLTDHLHLLDAAEPRPRLWRSISSRVESIVVALDTPVQRWRVRRRLLGQRVLAWGPAALRVAAGSGAQVTYRPLPPEGRVDPRVSAVLCHSELQRRRLGEQGCSAGIEVVPDPVLQARPPRRQEVVTGQTDHLWLLSDDTGRFGGQKLGIWSAALAHVMLRRRGRTLRLMIAGDDAGTARARRFVDQLGLPGMTTPAAGYPLEALAGLAEAMLVSPTGPCDGYAARVARANGLAMVATPVPEIREVVAGYDNVSWSSSVKPRHVARAMLKRLQEAEEGEPAVADG
jgi:hypothetical protein